MPRNRAEVVVISWRDIPAQVNARDGHERHQVLLPYRFQKAVDRATRVAGKKTAHEHVAEWKRRSFPIDGDALAAARTEAARIEALFPPERLHVLVAAGGWDPGGAPTPAGPPMATIDGPNSGESPATAGAGPAPPSEHTAG